MKSRFLEFVKAEAHKLGKEFFLDTGEGKVLSPPVSGWDVEELSGWLIDLSDAETFKDLWQDKRRLWDDDGSWGRFYCFVVWERIPDAAGDDPPIAVSFVPYPS